MKNVNMFIRLISLFLTLVMIVTTLASCGIFSGLDTDSEFISDSQRDSIINEIVSDILSDIETDTNTDIYTDTNSGASADTSADTDGDDNQGVVDDVIDTGSIVISCDIEDYLEDIEVFTYGLLVQQLECAYTVFPGFVEISTGEQIYGLGMTDYTECYEDEETGEIFFLSCFIPFNGEMNVPDEDFDIGLYIYNLDFQPDDTHFVFANKCKAFADHCVVFDQYLTYGVDESGKIFYESVPYIRGQCNESLGSLYSYDAGRYVFDNDFGDYVVVTGESLSDYIDFAEIERNMDALIKEQNLNFASFDVVSEVYNAHEAVNSLLLSLQEEMFLGFRVEDLINASKELDPLTCLRITEDGLQVIDVSPEPPPTPSLATKWLVGIVSGIFIAAGMVASIIFIECPALSALAGAVTGFAMEIFAQVIIENNTLSNIKWSKVIVASVAGAISGFVGPYMNAVGGVGGFLADSAIDGLIAGAEQAVHAWIDGERGMDALKSFGYGFVIGAGLSAAFKGIAAGLGALGKKIGKVISNNPNGLLAKASKILGKVVDNKVTNAMAKPFKKLKKIVDASPFHSEYICNKLKQNAIKKFVTTELVDGSRGVKGTLADLSVDGLSSKGLVDINGKPITKTELKKLLSKSKSGELIATVTADNGEILRVVNNNYIADIIPDSKYQKLILKGGVTGVREDNLKRAREQFINQWINDPDSIPDVIVKYLADKYPDEMAQEALAYYFTKEVDGKTTVIDTNVKKMIADVEYVLHESADLKTIYFIPRAIHNVNGYGGVSHYGGVSLAQNVEFYLGREYLDFIIENALKK